MKAAIAALLAAIVVLGAVAAHCWQLRHWRAWDAFAKGFVQPDGRVIDRTAGDRSTSEAQAYSLFFALVANDRARFAAILDWTRNNLAEGDLSTRLPAWLWGVRDDGSWGIRDSNPASDADLWLAYTLIEAGRLWQQPEYTATGRAMLALVKTQEVADIPGLGLMLLPAPQGFKAEDGTWRLNPSYLPEFQFRWLAQQDQQGPWQTIWQNHIRALRSLMKLGIAPDWYEVAADGSVGLDAKTQGVSSYDAIRVPLWAGMTPKIAGRDNELTALLKPMLPILAKMPAPPERLDSRSGAASGGAPIGYSAAVLPLLAILDEDTAVSQRQRLKNSRVAGSLGDPPHYYDQVLALFGEGWDSGRFRFAENGQVISRWENSCCDWLF